MNTQRQLRTIVCLALLVLLAGACAGPIRQAETPVFFPPEPLPPRIQFLTSFSGSKDIEDESAFDRFVVGEKQEIKLDKPYGIAIHDGKIYVCDTNTTLMVLDLKARTFGLLKGATGPGKLVQPLNITVGPDGTKYVSDPVRGQVVAFDLNDEYLRAYGEAGDWKPVDAVPFDDRLYVADMEKGVVQVFSLESGEVVKTIGDKGGPEERLNRPTNLAFDSEGYLYVSDFGKFQVLKFDRDGHFTDEAFGKLGNNLGHFARPKGVALDREGRLYAVDAAFNNVQIFNPERRLLMFFGKGGEERGDFLLPAQVSIDYDNVEYFREYVDPSFQPEYLILVTNQFGDRKVNVLAYGKQEGQEYPSDEDLLKEIGELRQKELEKLKESGELEESDESDELEAE